MFFSMKKADPLGESARLMWWNADKKQRSGPG
jgi:hypothetical protein